MIQILDELGILYYEILLTLKCMISRNRTDTIKEFGWSDCCFEQLATVAFLN